MENLVFFGGVGLLLINHAVEEHDYIIRKYVLPIWSEHNYIYIYI
jgi:hypothetical protein